jgi:hypothetical protein
MSLLPVTGGPRGSVAGAEVGAGALGGGAGPGAGPGAGSGAGAGAGTPPLVIVRCPRVMDLPPVGATAGAAVPKVSDLLPIR